MPKRVLIVDDERSIRLTVGQALESEGYQTSSAMTGEEAHAKIGEEPFDLVLLDIRMPGMDGIEVLRRLVAEQPDVAVVMVTAHGTVENAVEALKLGAVDFLQKPFTPVEIRQLVTQVLNRREAPPADAPTYEAHLELAKHALQRQQHAVATEHLRDALRLTPNRPEAFNLLGMILELQGDHREALNHYRAALDFDPSYAPALGNLQRATSRRGGGPDLGGV